MRKNTTKVLAGMVCLALLLGFMGGISPLRVQAASSWELQGQLDKLEEENEELQGKIDELRGQMNENLSELQDEILLCICQTNHKDIV